MALGAGRGDVLKLILVQAMAATLTGIGIGLVATFFLSRLLQSFLFGVGTLDPGVLTASVLVLDLVALVASFLPARRAIALDPLKALHEI